VGRSRSLRAIRILLPALPHVIHEVTPPAPAGASVPDPSTDHPKREEAMYDMYPEWGPAKHDPDNPRNPDQLAALQTAIDLRDNGGERPDDN
jgi:hypothetical protein